MAMEEITDAGELAEADHRTRWTGAYIGVLAVLLAICSMGGDNASKDANRANIDAADTWAFFQAKNVRRQTIYLAIDQIELKLTTEPTLGAEARKAYEAKRAEYKAFAAKLTSDKERNEGLDELFQQGTAYQAERNAALKRDPYFDWAQALLQIAIVLASVSIVARSWWLLGSSAMLGVAGALLTLDGFTMWLPVL